MKFVKQFLANRNGNGQTEQNENGRSKPLFDPNPYLNARRQWNSAIDRAFSSLHVWQLVALACLLIALAAVAGITWIGSQAKFVPYVIEVDKLGDTVAVGPALQAAPADPRVVRASLAAFISALRIVTPDQDLERKFIFAAYGMLKTRDPATVKANEFLGDNSEMSPFKRASRMTVDVDVSTVLPITEHAWQVDWQETVRDRDGALVGKPMTWRATLDVYLEPLGTNATQAQIQRNPLGLFVRDFSWQQR